MRNKRMIGSRRRVEVDQSPTLGELMTELSEVPRAENLVRAPRARRAGPFKVPASIAGAGNKERESIARRFQQHLKGVSGANKLGSDPDETVPAVRPVPQRPGRFASQQAVRPGLGFRPGMPSRFGRPAPATNDDDE